VKKVRKIAYLDGDKGIVTDYLKTAGVIAGKRPLKIAASKIQMMSWAAD
jgi:hypothetical protein